MLFDTFDRAGNAEFPFARQVVFRAICMAVDGLSGMTVENRDELASRLDVKTGISLFSWGEKVTITVTGNGPNAAVVSVQSGAKTILGSATTHGKNRENVREIITHTSKLLSQHGAQWAEELGMAPNSQESHSAGSSKGLIADELMKLAALRDKGLLTDEEFKEQKARLLG